MQRTYTIKEFEKVTGVTSHTLRYFDKIGLLSPSRGKNGYRVYSLQQVSIAEMIILLQQAMFTNAEIKELLTDYNSEQTLQRLRENRVKLRQEIINLRKVYRSLDDHIDYLEQLKTVRERLHRPVIEQMEQRVVGLIKPRHVRDIVDYFDAGDEIIGDPAWPHFFTHGVLVSEDSIIDEGYPFQAMYVENDKVAKECAHLFPAGEYLTMYCEHSMENNPNVVGLIEHARKIGFEFAPLILVEQVSGPVIEKSKKEFLVRIMLQKQADKIK